MLKRKNKERDSEISFKKMTGNVRPKDYGINFNVVGDTKQKNPEVIALESSVFGLDTDTFHGDLESASSSAAATFTAPSAGTSFLEAIGVQSDEPDEPSQKKVRQPVWHDDEDDDDDPDAFIKVGNDRRYRQIRRNNETKISAGTYRARLRERFEKVVGDGSWARLDRDERKSDSDSDDEEEKALLRSTGTYLTSSQSLAKGAIDCHRSSDLNKLKASKGMIRNVEFHPWSQVALVAGVDHTFNLFQVDGRSNPHIQSVFMDKFPILTAHFTRDGKEIILGSKHKSFSYYDMTAGKLMHKPHIRGLEKKGGGYDRMGYFEVSPDGETIAFRGNDGMIYLVSAKSKQWIGNLKMNGSCDAMTFNQDGSRMFSFGSDGDVYVWDMRSRQCIHRFADDGCLKGMSITCSGNNQYIATGSGTGVVNVYDYDHCMASERPTPLKAVLNLRTPCTQVRFNHSNEILAIASDKLNKAMKMVHFPSLTVFSNFPDRTDNMGMPTCCDFSPQSGYMAVATRNGRAQLYRLKHYGSF